MNLEKVVIIKNIKDYLQNHHIISIIGTAKNAGKTTVLNKIIDSYQEDILAITSIGLDGEKIDNVTFQEKPQITVTNHTIIATAKQCLDMSTIEYVIYEETSINTPLGPIVILEVTKPGDVLVAGPSTNTDMKKLINKFIKYHPKKILIDGALFRKSIASTRLVDGVILVTGASYHHDMDVVVRDTKSLVDQLTLTKSPFIINDSSENQFISDENMIIEGSLIAEEEKLIEGLKSYETLYLKGALSKRIVRVLKQNRHDIKLKNIIVRDGSHILLDDTSYTIIKKLNIELYALNEIDILFIAYNPTSPYHEPFDNDTFKNKLQTMMNETIINVCRDLE